MKTSSIAKVPIAAIFAAGVATVYAQTGWHVAAQGDKSIATSGELKTPAPRKSSVQGITGAAGADRGVVDRSRSRGARNVTGHREPNTDVSATSP